MNPDEKACPFCAETIKIAATICRHCKSPLTGQGPRPQRRPVAVPAKGGGFPAWGIVLIVVGVLFFFIAVVAAIAIPGLLSASRASNERITTASLKTIATAEADFRSNDRDNNRINDFWVANVRGLYTGPAKSEYPDFDLKLIEIAVAEADTGASPASRPIAGNSTSYPKAGYHYQMILLDENGAKYGGGNGSKDPYHNLSTFGVCSYPSQYGSVGKLTFVISEACTVFKKDTGAGTPIEAFPNDREKASGWTPMW